MSTKIMIAVIAALVVNFASPVLAQSKVVLEKSAKACMVDGGQGVAWPCEAGGGD